MHWAMPGPETNCNVRGPALHQIGPTRFSIRHWNVFWQGLLGSQRKTLAIGNRYWYCTVFDEHVGLAIRDLPQRFNALRALANGASVLRRYVCGNTGISCVRIHFGHLRQEVDDGFLTDTDVHWVDNAVTNACVAAHLGLVRHDSLWLEFHIDYIKGYAC